MSMTLRSRRELYKLRELVSFFLVGQKCFFCKKPLCSEAEQFTKHGNAVGPKLTEKLTIHHKDGNHDNDAHDNKAPCHTRCHKSYHRTLSNNARAAAKQETFCRCCEALLTETDILAGHCTQCKEML